MRKHGLGEQEGPIRGRGVWENPQNRFEELYYDATEIEHEDSPGPVPTRYFVDVSRSLITNNESPDVPFDASFNPYRGCEHGCVYCYARPTHEYLGLSSGLDFETRIFVKTQAPLLLRKELSSPTWKPQVLGLSGVTDCYQPAEARFRITRSCLEVLHEFHNPVAMVTKNHGVTRDVDLLEKMAEWRGVGVFISITTLDKDLAKILEPRASSPQHRLSAISELTRRGIPCGVLVAPVIPALNDHEIPAILSAASQAGAGYASYVLLRLPYAVKDLFSHWLEQYFPERRQKVLHRLQEMRKGKLNETAFGERMRGSGVFSEQIDQLFHLMCRRYRLSRCAPQLNSKNFKSSSKRQYSLFNSD